MQIIAEVKTQSPFGWKSDKSWEELFDVANEFGDIISVHTDTRWGGSFDLVKKACSLTNKPILAKGIHSNDSDVLEAFSAGAKWVLVVGRVPMEFHENLMIEPWDLNELKNIPKNIRAVWNNRDLAFGGPKVETFEQARKLFSGWLCQASFIKTVNDVNKEADAVLVGTDLVQFVKSMVKNEEDVCG